MAWTTRDIPDLNGRVAVVTGANSGLGFESSLALAAAGARVFMAGRNLGKVEAARTEILLQDESASLDVVELDLSSLASVKSAADTINAETPKVDVLLNNAGLMAMPEQRTEDGFESQLGVNHLGHWALTAHLMPAILAAPSARVVTVTSTAHHFGREVDPNNPNLEGIYDPWKAYGQSKLANYYFAIGLNREFDDRGLAAKSLVAHPGLSRTNLQLNTVAQGGAGKSGSFWARMAARTGMEPARGALPQLRAATDPSAIGGSMYAPRFINFGSPVRRPVLRRIGIDEAIANLWAISEEMTGITLQFEGVDQPGNN